MIRYAAARHARVVALGHAGPSGEDITALTGAVEWHLVDVSLDNLLERAGKPELIFHCAGGALVPASYADPLADFDRTVTTTAIVLEFMRRAAPQARLVLPSSAAVYGVARKLPIREDYPLAPISPYGAHKKISEDVCHSFARHFDLSVSIVRLFSIYGPGLRKQLLWDACSKFRENDAVFSGTGEERRDLLHVEDAVSLLATASQHASPECPVANGATGAGIRVREILCELAETFGMEDQVAFRGDTRAGDPRDYIADVATAKSWGWSPEREWRTGIREYADWYRRLRVATSAQTQTVR